MAADATGGPGVPWQLVLPLLGLLFLPLTMLVYVVDELGNGVRGWAWMWVVRAFFLDLVTHGSGVRSTQRRVAIHPAS